MPILMRIVPEPQSIKDYRADGQVYYEAKCDQCGRIYYPKRPTARYCSKRCGIEYRNGNTLANPPESKLVEKLKNPLMALEKLKQRLENQKIREERKEGRK